MRWKVSVCTAALVLFGYAASVGTAAARPKPRVTRAKGKATQTKAVPAPPVRSKPTELMTDDRSITKQMQWEDKVMGPNSKKAELAKIARAQAITRAAAEKAAAEKAAGLDVKEPAPAARPQARATVNLPALPDESGGRPRADDKKRDVSATVVTDEAAPPPPTKPTDDKFIDKLLNGDGTTRRRTAEKSNDSELDLLLAKETDKPLTRGRPGDKADVVDKVLASAEKEADKPVAKPRQPEWTKPEPAAAPPPPAPVAVKPPPRKDGVIHVIQGANYAAPSATSLPSLTASTARRAPSPASDPPAAQKPASRAPNWEDPFADTAATSRKPASGATTKKEGTVPAPGWRDPFADVPAPNKGKSAPSGSTKRNSDSSAAPAATPGSAPARWKDPFTQRQAARSTVAIAAVRAPEPRRRDLGRRAPRVAPKSPAEPSSPWAVLKKRAP